MKIKYYTEHCRFMVLIFIVYFLLGACSRLGNRYGVNEVYKAHTFDVDYISNRAIVDLNQHADEGYGSSSAMDYNPLLSPWSEKLFSAIGNDDIDKVEVLLTNLKENGLENMCELDPANMSSCLHKAVENSGLHAVAIMERLLDKMKPLLLSKKGREDLLARKEKIQYFVQGSAFWKEDNIKDYLEKKVDYSTSVLLWRNDLQETPLLIATKRGSPDMLKLVLAYTHKFVGLNHTDHIDETSKDFLDIALEQSDHRKLAYLMREVCTCSARSTSSFCIHFLGMSKCQSESVIRAIGSDKKKLLYLFKAVHNNKLERLNLLLNTIVTVLGPADCLKFFTKKCPGVSPGYTLLHTALDKNFLEEEDKHTLNTLTKLLNAILDHTPRCASDSIKQKLIDLLSNSGPKRLESMKSIVELLQEHRCLSDLYDLDVALRIIIESESPEGQFYALASA